MEKGDRTPDEWGVYWPVINGSNVGNKNLLHKRTSALAREEKRREEEELKPSEAIASAVKPPLTPDEIIFGYGVPILTNAGTAEKQARSFLGGLRKAHGDDAVVNTLRECIRAKPLQPLEWLAKAMPPAGSAKTPNKQEALEMRNRAVADAWATEMESKMGVNCEAV